MLFSIKLLSAEIKKTLCVSVLHFSSTGNLGIFFLLKGTYGLMWNFHKQMMQLVHDCSATPPSAVYIYIYIYNSNVFFHI